MRTVPVALLLLMGFQSPAINYYMATTGLDANAGTSTGAPWKTLTKAGGSMRAGDTLFIRGGTYNCDPTTGTYQYFSPGYFTANGGAAGQGTQANPIVVTNYPGEIPLFINGNFSGSGIAPFTLGFNSWIKIFGISMSNCNLASINLVQFLTNCEVAYCTLGPSATNKRGGVLLMGDGCVSNYIHHNTIFGSWSSEQTNAFGRQGESGDVVSFGIAGWNVAGADTNSTCRYNVFATNTIYQGGHSAFNPQGARDCYFLGNRIHNEIWINWPDYQQLGGHRAAGAFGGWSLYDGNDFGYAGNPLANDGAEGLGIFGQFNIVRRNTMHHNENFGFVIYDKGVAGGWHAHSNHVYNNTIAHNALGQMSQTNYFTSVVTDLSASKAATFLAGSTNNVFVNNLYAFNGGQTGTNGIEFRGSTTTSDANAFARTNWFNHLTGDPLFQNDTNELYYLNHLVGNPFSTNPTEFHLSTSSPVIDKATWLTTITSGNGTGTSFVVGDPYYFWAGATVAGYTFPGDSIQLQGQTTRVVITAIDTVTKTITVNAPLTWTIGQGVALAYNGSAPDFGAIESGDSLSGGAALASLNGKATLNGKVTLGQ